MKPLTQVLLALSVQFDYLSSVVLFLVEFLLSIQLQGCLVPCVDPTQGTTEPLAFKDFTEVLPDLRYILNNPSPLTTLTHR